MPEVGLLDAASGPVAGGELDARGGIRARLARRPLLWGPGLAMGGAVALTVALVGLTASAGVSRYALAGAGLAAGYVGVDLLLGRVAGPDFSLELWVSIGWLVGLVASAGLVDVLPLAESRDVSQALTEPIRLRPDLLSRHPLGTDGQGLDILGGILYGARVSLTIGAGAIAIGLAVGVIVGVAAGYFRGRLDLAVSFLTDSMLAFPPLVFLLAMAAAFAPSIPSVTVALGVLAVPTYIRLARANTLVFAQREFVVAARALGERDRAVIGRELLPNVLLPVLSFSFLLIAAFIVAEASLSFLGLSVSRPAPTWGNMIASGQDAVDEDPHLVFVPGVVLFVTVFALNRVGEHARRRWDPREAKL